MPPSTDNLREFLQQPPWSLLLEHRSLDRFSAAVDQALSRAASTADAREIVRDAATTSAERTLYELAFALLRGWGPAIRPEDLWGFDPDQARRVLAALAWAMDPGTAPEQLHEAREAVMDAWEQVQDRAAPSAGGRSHEDRPNGSASTRDEAGVQGGEGEDVAPDP